MEIKPEREKLDMWFEKERSGSEVTSKLRIGASEVKAEDELFYRCIEGPGIFFIWSDIAYDNEFCF